MGRPVEFGIHIITKAQEYLAACEDVSEDVVSGKSKKFTTYRQTVIVKLPSIEGLAYFLGIARDTVYDWCGKYEAFSDIISILRVKQAERLINKGLSGDYNPYIAKVLLAKHGYHDKQEVEHSLPRGQSFKIGGQEISF